MALGRRNGCSVVSKSQFDDRSTSQHQIELDGNLSRNAKVNEDLWRETKINREKSHLNADLNRHALGSHASSSYHCLAWPITSENDSEPMRLLRTYSPPLIFRFPISHPLYLIFFLSMTATEGRPHAACSLSADLQASSAAEGAPNTVLYLCEHAVEARLGRAWGPMTR